MVEVKASGPLAGINILEIGQLIAVPSATYVLASQGASVIKVERVDRGDEMRNYGSQKKGLSGWFANVNSGKRSIALDINVPSGKEILWQLLAQADVMIQGYRPGVLARQGFGYDVVHKHCPKLIYCSSTGFGEEGPYAALGAYDPLIQALAGWAGAQQVDGADGELEPTLVKAMVADKIAATVNAQALTAALVQRGKTGEGLYVETSMLESNIAFNWPDVMMHCTLLDEDATHLPNLLASYRLYQCKDGHVSVAVGNDVQWQSFCTAFDLRKLSADPRYITAAVRALRMPEFFGLLSSTLLPYDVAEVVEKLRAADVPVAPVLSPDVIKDDAQVAARKLIRKVSHPEMGEFLQPRSASNMFGVDLELTPAPGHGEHSKEILQELGYTDEAIEPLIQGGIVLG